MEFIGNIHGVFVLDTVSPTIKEKMPERHRYFDITQAKHQVLVKVKSINLHEGVSFKLHEIHKEDLNAFVETMVRNTIRQLRVDVALWKVLANRVIERYETDPDEFDYVNRYDGFYMNNKVLTSKEYGKSVYVFICDNCELGSRQGYNFTKGCGEFSYEPKEYFTKRLAEIDKDVEDTIKKITSSAYKQKMKNWIMKFGFTLSFDEVIKYISVLQ